MMMSRPVNAPDGTPEDGILLSYACTLKPGKTLADAYKAHLEYGQTMKAKGSLSVSWMYTPTAGFGDSPQADYYHPTGFIATPTWVTPWNCSSTVGALRPVRKS